MRSFFTQTKPATQAQPRLRLPFDSPAPRSGGLLEHNPDEDFGSFNALEPSQIETMVPDDFSQPGLRRRLVRGRARDVEHEESQVTDDTPAETVSQNAHQVLMAAARNLGRHLKHKEKAKEVHAAFVQDEANESDEDALRGFGTGTRGDDEDDDEEQGKVVEGLVDDARMDADVENADAVIEKAM